MYEIFMHTLRQFFGSGPLRLALAVTLPLVVLALVAWASPTFRAAYRQWRERGGWRGALAAIAGGAFKLLAVLVLARLIIVAMTFQAQEFESHHGEITERNRSAVLMKWGSPHEQRELGVSFHETRTWVVRKVKLPGEKGQVIEQAFWADEELPLQEVDGQKPVVLNTQREDKALPVDQQGIESADVQITVKDNPRTLRNANYAGYDDLWRLAYTIVNRHNKPVTAEMRFAFPAERGVYNNLVLTVDGQDLLGAVRSEEGDLVWQVEMKPDQRRTVKLAYDSHGLESLRYIPKRMTQTGHYRIAIHMLGVEAAKLNWPIGSMPAAEKLSEIRGTDYTLTWSLDNALTSYDVGVLLPVAQQPQYHFARLLEQAPIGLVMLLAMLVLPRLIGGYPLSLATVALLSAAYYLFYTFMGNLADLVPGFTVAFIISVAALGTMVAVFRRADRSSTFLGCQDILWFVALTVLYPLAVIDGDRTGFWMQLFYLGLLLYACALALRFRVVSARPSPAS